MQLDAKWIWGDEARPNTWCYLRGRFAAEDVVMRARLRISADTNYMLWLNGRYVGQGPGPYVREVRPVDEYDVTGLVREGDNVICVTANWWGMTSHSRPKGAAGVIAELSWEDAGGATHHVGTGEGWRALIAQAWERDTPRRNADLGFTEYFDATREPVGWLDPDFDDSAWPHATLAPGDDRRLFPRLVPLLREWSEQPVALAGAWRAGRDAPGPGDREPELTEFLDTEPLTPLAEARRADLAAALLAPGAATIHWLPTVDGLALTLDLGREIVAHLELDIDAPAGGRIDLAPAELLRDGRPWCYRKGTKYAQRYLTRAGRQRWATFDWHGLRYLHVVLRGFDGPVTIRRLGVLRRESDLDWRAQFSSSDETLNRVWEIGRHTLRVATQEVQVDCPTREQAAYWGDATWIGLWTLWLTGDCSHVRHLLLSAEHAAYESGQLPASIFSSLDQILFDYTLIMPWGLHAYWWNTGDLSPARRLAPTVEGLLRWYRERTNDAGLVEFDAVAAHARGEGTLFIDHPGLGWHNFPHPGIDRRGLSAGLNLFYLRALQCWSELLAVLGEEGRASTVRAEAGKVARAIEQTFFDPQRGVYVDAVVAGRQSQQISQQINTLAVLADVCPPERRRRLLERVLSDDPSLCRCSPYFWLYQFRAMSRAGMQAQMLEAIRELWGAMADAGATTWWETFLGDELDSLCHPWSSAPNQVLQSDLLGVLPAEPGFTRVQLRPRPDLVAQVRGTVQTVRGEISVGWQSDHDAGATLVVGLPEGMSGLLHAPAGWRIEGADGPAEVVGGAEAVFVLRRSVNTDLPTLPSGRKGPARPAGNLDGSEHHQI